MNGFKRLIHEAHRRSLWQVLGIYCLGAWFAYEVILGLQEGVGLPEWVPPMAIVLFLIGLPIVLATAFVQEGAPGTGRPGSATPSSAETPPQPSEPAPLPESTAAEPAGFLARHLTWRRALGGGLVAFALLGIATAGFLGMRSMGIGPVGTLVAKGVLEERDPVILADFDNSTTDGGLGRVITDALRIDLLESTMVRVVDPADVDQVLERMDRAGAPLTSDLAREVAIRGGWKAILHGEVAPVGSGYLLTGSIVSAADGAVLAGFRRQARTPDELLSAIDALSKDIRAKVGESLRSVQAGEPLAEVSTASLPALRTFSQAIRLEFADPVRAIQLLEEAVELDPEFAMAHRKLAVMLTNADIRKKRRVEAATRTWELRDRLNERERGHAVAFYHLSVTGDRAAAIAAYRSLLDRYPDDDAALNNLALALIETRAYPEAEAVLERIVGELVLVNVNNLIDARFAQGDTAGAWEAVERSAGLVMGDVPLPMVYRAFLYAGTGDLARAAAVADSSLDRTENLVVRTIVGGFGANVAAARGGLARSRELADDLAIKYRDGGLSPKALETTVQRSVHLAEVVRDSAAALRVLERGLERDHLAKMDPYDRPYLALAVGFAKAGDPGRAAALLDRYESEVQAEHRGREASTLTAARGVVALHAGDAAEAVRLLQEATRTLPCRICYLPELGRAYAALGQADSAVAAHERFLETPALFRYPSPGFQTPRVLEDLARLYEEVGERDKAAATYARLLDLWEDADPELQPRVEAARDRLQRLAAAEG